MNKLLVDIGCGRNKKKGYIGIDSSEWSDADHIIDIGRDELPFKSESVSIIYSAHTFEHLNNEELILAMNECWRVLDWGGQMFLHVPQMNSTVAWQDPTHSRYFVKDSIKFFCGDYLIKYRLDYDIECAFVNYETLRYYPNGNDEESKKYCTMLQFSLRKDKSHWNSVLRFYPFGTYDPPTNVPKWNPRAFDPHTEARKGELVGGVNYEMKMKKVKPVFARMCAGDAPKTHMGKFRIHCNEVAYKAFYEQIDKIIEIKQDASIRYGDDPAPLGTKGLFADLNRKFTRIKRFFWDEIQETTKENIIDTLYDNAIYSILMAMQFEKESKE